MKQTSNADLNSHLSIVITQLEFEPIHTKGENTQYKANIITKRNDSWLNNHQHLQLQGWRANCDIHPVIDYHACIEYLTKYASKGEPRSPLLKHAFNSIVHNSDNNINSTNLIKKIIMKTLGQRDYSAQETMHHLRSLKQVSSSFNVVPISLNGSRRIKTQDLTNSDAVTNDTLLDVYSKRQNYTQTIPNVMGLNFVEFATKYKLVSKKLINQPKNVIPRFSPNFSSNSKGPNFGLYCKYQLLRYKPWHTAHENAWGDLPGTDEIYFSKWKEFLDTSYAKHHVPEWHEKLTNVHNLTEDFKESSQELQVQQREQWMHLSDLVSGSFINPGTTQESTQSDCDWQNDKLKYAVHQVQEMPA